MQEPKDRVKLAKKLIGFFCILIGGILIFVNGYYWLNNSEIAHFIWSGAYRLTWWSSTGHIPLAYWGMISGILVLISAVLVLLPRDDIHSLGCALAIIFSVIGVVASGGWMIGFILGVVGGLLSALWATR